MPVLQGYYPDEYVSHLEQYGSRLRRGQWVGAGSVCKRNASIVEIEDVLLAIHQKRPDLRLHGFDVKKAALSSTDVRSCLWNADSMAWSYAASGRSDRNSWLTAMEYLSKIDEPPSDGRGGSTDP